MNTLRRRYSLEERRELWRRWEEGESVPWLQSRPVGVRSRNLQLGLLLTLMIMVVLLVAPVAGEARMVNASVAVRNSFAAGIPDDCFKLRVSSFSKKWALFSYKYAPGCPQGDGVAIYTKRGKDWVFYNSWSSPPCSSFIKLRKAMGKRTFRDMSAEIGGCY